MNRPRWRDIRLTSNWREQVAHRVSLGLFALFLIQYTLVWVRQWVPLLGLGAARWPDGLLLVLAAATTLASMARQLPGQNVLLAAVIVGALGGAAHAIGALSGVPFGPFVYTENIGPRVPPPLPWAVPMIWVTAVLASRGVARLILRPWRKVRVYGFWVMGLTTVLVVFLDLGLEPYATRVKHFWLWESTRLGFGWYGAPWVNFVGWAAVTLLILAFATPSLLQKKPAKQPPDYQSLVVWLLIQLLFATGAGRHQLWPAVWVTVGGSLVAAVFAVRGARW